MRNDKIKTLGTDKYKNQGEKKIYSFRQDINCNNLRTLQNNQSNLQKLLQLVLLFLTAQFLLAASSVMRRHSAGFQHA